MHILHLVWLLHIPRCDYVQWCRTLKLVLIVPIASFACEEAEELTKNLRRTCEWSAAPENGTSSMKWSVGVWFCNSNSSVNVIIVRLSWSHFQSAAILNHVRLHLMRLVEKSMFRSSVYLVFSIFYYYTKCSAIAYEEHLRTHWRQVLLRAQSSLTSEILADVALYTEVADVRFVCNSELPGQFCFY